MVYSTVKLIFTLALFLFCLTVVFIGAYLIVRRRRKMIYGEDHYTKFRDLENTRIMYKLERHIDKSKDRF